MSISFGVEDLEDHIRNVLFTDFIKKTTPVSTLIVAPPERNKSNTVIKFKGKNVLTLNDLTAYGLMKEVEKHTVNGKCDLGHLIIPDLTRLSARSRSVRKELLTTLQILMAEGMKGIHTYNIDVQFKNPLKLGVIGCITRLDLKDRRNVWSKTGLLSRFIPFSFDYDEKLKIDILSFINGDQNLKKQIVKINRKQVRHVGIPEKIKTSLMKDARRIAFDIEQFCKTPDEDRIFGARALNQITTYIKAIALRRNETIVNDYHYYLFSRYLHYFNYNCPLILPREVEGNSNG
jgi:hypothetical protein